MLGYVVGGERMLGPLEKAKDWLVRNNGSVMAVVAVAIGLVLIKNGVTGL